MLHTAGAIIVAIGMSQLWRQQMSKAMFGFLLLCSMAIYNPEGARNFATQHASELTWQLKNALYTVDRMLPSFLRYSRS
jgi:hypothetical protein